MLTIRACGLDMTDAEDVLAKIWCVLEMCEIRSPRLRVDGASNGTIDLRISFKHARDADLIMRSLPDETQDSLIRDVRLFARSDRRAPLGAIRSSRR